jgi:hypothetical protein
MDNSSKWVKYEKAKASALYHELEKICIDRLAAHGAFEKDEVTAAAGMEVFADAIRWDYIARMITDSGGGQLIPMAGSFFKRHKAAHALEFPGKYIATGHGKKTEGYALANRENGHFVIYRLVQKQNIEAGVHRQVESFKQTAMRIGVIQSPILLESSKA